MAILSSHLLNAITGEHAGNVKITLSNLDSNTSNLILETNTDEGGRLSENIEIDFTGRANLRWSFLQKIILRKKIQTNGKIE